MSKDHLNEIGHANQPNMHKGGIESYWQFKVAFPPRAYLFTMKHESGKIVLTYCNVIADGYDTWCSSLLARAHFPRIL